MASITPSKNIPISLFSLFFPVSPTLYGREREKFQTLFLDIWAAKELYGNREGGKIG
jgi:hypothetical protein